MNNLNNMIIDLNILGDYRGSLVSLEELRNIPFNIKRVYYIFHTKSFISRGFHAHKSLEQLLVCVSGSCDILLDDGTEKVTLHVNKPNQGVFVDKMIWHEMHNFSEDCVLLVLASDYYDESDYIRDYGVFLAETVSISFLPYNEEFLNKSKLWLRDEEIKKLTMTPDFNDESQLNWFNSLQQRENYFIKGIMFKNQCIGVMGIKNINNHSGEYWGYIGEKQFWGRGLGKYLIDFAIRYAKSKKLEYLYLRVDKDNERAIKLYRKFDFKELFIESNTIYMIKYIQ